MEGRSIINPLQVYEIACTVRIGSRLGNEQQKAASISLTASRVPPSGFEPEFWP